MTIPLGKPFIDWGVAAAAMPGQSESGDLHLVKLLAEGALVAVVDGLGHGEEAAAAAQIAVATLENHAPEPLAALVQHCHEALKRTRGVVMSLAYFNASDSTMTWLGVGNVEGVLFRAGGEGNRDRESMPARGGVIGYQLPPFRPSTLPVRPGDILIFATDGVRSNFIQGLSLGDSPQEVASGILARFSKSNDDALVLVIRYLGDAP